MDYWRIWMESHQEVHNETCDHPTKMQCTYHTPTCDGQNPMHIDEDLADLSWLPDALNPDSKQDKQINTPTLSCIPTQEWITIDQPGSPDNINCNIQTFWSSMSFVGGGTHPP